MAGITGVIGIRGTTVLPTGTIHGIVRTGALIGAGVMVVFMPDGIVLGIMTHGIMILGTTTRGTGAEAIGVEAIGAHPGVGVVEDLIIITIIPLITTIT